MKLTKNDARNAALRRAADDRAETPSLLINRALRADLFRLAKSLGGIPQARSQLADTAALVLARLAGRN